MEEILHGGNISAETNRLFALSFYKIIVEQNEVSTVYCLLD